MIRIRPFYEWNNKDQILSYYLNLVADVVPFFPADVLDEIEEAPDSLSHNPRRRNETYRELLKEIGVYSEKTKEERRVNDARLAEHLIQKYSHDLHEYLYREPTDDSHPGAVNRKKLRLLLTAQLHHGEIPKDLVFSDRKIGNKDSEGSRLLEYVFRYEAFSGKNVIAKQNGEETLDAEQMIITKKRARDVYHLLSMMPVEVCPYCNRQFISLILDGEKQTRPQLDHFKSKISYPHLALSINNLVPCCGICNLMKHDDDNPMLYPYDEDSGDVYVFETKDREGEYTDLRTGATRAPEKFDVTLRCIVNKDDPKAVRAKGSIDTLALEKLYQNHKTYITDLYYQRYIHTDALLEDIITQFPELFRPKSDREASDIPSDNGPIPQPLSLEERTYAKEDLKRALLMMDYRPESWEKRPLAKLTHDISAEIDRLVENNETKQ